MRKFKLFLLQNNWTISTKLDTKYLWVKGLKFVQIRNHSILKNNIFRFFLSLSTLWYMKSKESWKSMLTKISTELQAIVQYVFLTLDKIWSRIYNRLQKTRILRKELWNAMPPKLQIQSLSYREWNLFWVWSWISRNSL